MAEFVDGVVDTADFLDRFNEGRMGPIELDDTESEFVVLCRALQGRDDSVIHSTLQAYLKDAVFD